jgi:hypothetical protein
MEPLGDTIFLPDNVIRWISDDDIMYKASPWFVKQRDEIPLEREGVLEEFPRFNDNSFLLDVLATNSRCVQLSFQLGN